MVAYFAESYQSILRRSPWREFTALAKHLTLVFFFVFMYLFATQKGELFSRTTLLGCCGISLVVIYAMRQMLKKLLRKTRIARKTYESLLVLTSKECAPEIVRRIREGDDGSFRLKGLVLTDAEPGVKEIEGVSVIAAPGGLAEYVRQNWVDSIFVSLPESLSVEKDVIDSCVMMGVTVHFDMKQLYQGGTQYVSKLAGINVISTTIVSGSNRDMLVKRCIDIAGGLVGCALTGILFLFVAPCIYIKSPGPIFFSQVRIGRNGRRFKIYKFRSMYLDAEERKKELMARNQIKDGHMFKIKDDPRIIPGIGHFIRKTGIDEFPQFLNVLKGDMSLIGTRPPTVDEWEKYDESHRVRMAIRPGLTGLWQVSGRSNIVDFDQAVELDREYITEWSWTPRSSLGRWSSYSAGTAPADGRIFLNIFDDKDIAPAVSFSLIAGNQRGMRQNLK